MVGIALVIHPGSSGTLNYGIVRAKVIDNA